MTFEAYSVAVRLKLIDGVSSGLMALAGQFTALNRQASAHKGHLSDIEKQLNRLKLMGTLGGAAAAAGGYGLSLFKAPIEEAKAFQTELTKFRALGVGEHVTQEAQRFAEGMQSFGTSMRDNLVLLRDAQTIFGDFEHAKMVTPLLAKMKFANEALYGAEGGGMKDRAFMDMLKVIELRRGLSSEQAFKSQANMVQQVLTATGGRVGANEYLQLIKTGGVAAKGISDETFYYKLEPLIQELGGMRVGTGLMSAYQNLMLGRTSVQVAKELGRLGLLDEGHVEYNKIGMIKRILPGGLVGGDVLSRDPIEFLEKVLLPSFAKKGITSEKDVLQELGLIFSNRTASQLFSTIFLQMANIKKNEALNRGAMGVDELDRKARETPGGKEIELHAKWRDVLKELGTTVLPIAIQAVTGLTSVVKGVVAFAREFPTLTKWLTIGFGVLAGLVAVGGVLAMATAGFKALGLALVVSKGTGIGTMLLEVAGGVSGLAMALGKAGLVGAAGYGGWKLGGWLNDNVVNPGVRALTGDKNQTLGGWLYDKTHWGNGASIFGGNYYTESNYVAGARAAAGQGKGNVYLDGRKVGEIVTGHQARAASMPLTGISGFDGRQQLTPAGGF